MQKFYNPSTITNSGECLIDRDIANLFDYDKDEWYIFHSMVLSSHISQRQGECDFVLLNKRGILVLEVKEGKIGINNTGFVQLADEYHRNERPIDPVTQVEDNVSSIRELLNKNNINNCFVCGAIAFPQCYFEVKGSGYNTIWSQSNKSNIWKFAIDTLEEKRYFTIQGLKKKYPQNADKYEKLWPELDKKSLNQILEVLKPQTISDSTDASLILNREQSLERAKRNISILKGLQENRRLMIQGPPGSGKSKYALAFIENKVKKQNENGLYICWNELLAAEMNLRFESLKINHKIIAVSYYSYIHQLLKRADLPEVNLSFDNIHEIKKVTQQVIAQLIDNGKMDSYDFLVCDEAQDVFDKGIEILIDKALAMGNNGIENGEYLIFYDLLQAFSNENNIEDYHFTLNYLKHHCAIYKLEDSFRSSSVDGLNNFLADLDTGYVDFGKFYGKDINIFIYDMVKELPGLILKTVTDTKKKYKLEIQQCALLFSSNLISGNEASGKPLDELLKPETFLKLNNTNYNQESGKIKYTTALKFKGLEKDAIFLVINDLYNLQHQNIYQLKIGATRASAKLFLFIDRKSTESNKF